MSASIESTCKSKDPFIIRIGIFNFAISSAGSYFIQERSDDLFPFLALNYFGTFAGVVFLIGIIAAAFSSADSALTALTTSFYVDIIDLPKKKESNQKKIRMIVHIGFTLLMFCVIILFNEMNDSSVVSAMFKVAGFTYGPLLSLFVYGLISKRQVKDKWVPLVCVLAPIISVILNINSESWFNGYQFGFEILLVNAALTCVGMRILYVSKPGFL